MLSDIRMVKPTNKKMYIIIMEQIIDWIKHNEIKPGDKLPNENELIEKLNVSRPSVREALCGLEILGIIYRKPGKGIFVNKDLHTYNIEKAVINRFETEFTPSEIFEVRKIIEPEIAYSAAERANTKELKNIERIQQKMEESIKEKKLKMLFKYNEAFHLEIAKATKNPIFYKIIEDILVNKQDKIWSKISIEFYKDKSYSLKYLTNHKKLYFAIRNHEPDLAKRLMFNNLNESEKDFLLDEKP